MTTAIRHRIGIDAPQATVHDALTTTDGIASWWTRDTAGDAAPGGTIDLHFGGPDKHIVLEVVEATPDRVQWRGLPGGPDEWIDTTMTFELDHQDDETVVLFTHGGWREPVLFQAHCSTKWGSYLLSLKSLLDGGEAAPFPRDVHISSWD
jgi:uncharacterized protein YndB with AHSA1/START domain